MLSSVRRIIRVDHSAGEFAEKCENTDCLADGSSAVIERIFALLQDLTSFFLPPPHGVGENSESGGTPANDGALSTRSSPYPSGPEVKHAFDGCPDAVHSLSDRVNGVRPTNFPLFPPAGAADNAESQAVSIAKVPVSLCWVKRERPRTFDRVTRKFRAARFPPRLGVGFFISAYTRSLFTRGGNGLVVIRRYVENAAAEA